MPDSSVEDEISIVNFDPYDLKIPAGGISLSLGPFESYQPPPQQDMFRHYIQSQWLHSSHLADEDPQWQIEAWIKKHPHMQELYQEGTLEIVHHDHVEYYHRATEQEHFAWRLRWSEHIENQKLSIVT